MAFGCLAGLLLYTYDLKFKTRQLEAQAQTLANDLQDENDYLALMRAETQKLSNPERIEEMARKQLKLEPMAPAQMIPWRAILASSDWQPRPVPARKDGIASLIEKAAGSAVASQSR